MSTDSNYNVKDHKSTVDFIQKKSVGLKPKLLVMNDLKWKFLVRSAVRGKNIMMTGPTGSGKTLAHRSLVQALKRPDFYFNLGSTQDPRSTLVGTTGFDKENGTYFSKSAFVNAITTPDAIILLDELSRAHPDAWNILMTVLDQDQRYLRLDESPGSPTVKVAEGVTFVATANIGNEYTSTRVMDRAIMDRFVIIEMDVLNEEQEFDLLKYLYPNMEEKDLRAISEVADHTRKQCKLEGGKLTSAISTRATVETCSLIYDGFSLMEAAEVCILPYFDTDGNVDSERTYVTQYLQKFIDVDESDKLYNNVDDSESSIKNKVPVF